MSRPRMIVFLATALLGLLSERLSAQQVVDRRETNQPILLMDTESPSSNVFALRFARDDSGGLCLLAAGEGKVVWQWQVRQDAKSKMISLDPLPRVRWPINRGSRGSIYAIASGRVRAAESSVMAFSGISLLPGLVQFQSLQNNHALTVLHSDEGSHLQSRVNVLEFWPEPSKLLAVGCEAFESKRAVILIWDIEQSARPRAVLETGFDVVQFLSVAPNGLSLVATDGSGQRVRRWTIRETDAFKADDPVEISVPSPVVGFAWLDEHRCFVATRRHGLISLDENQTKTSDSNAVRLVFRNRTSRPLTLATRRNGEILKTWEVASERSQSGTTPAVQQIAIRDGNQDWQTTDLNLSASPSWEFDVDFDSSGRPRIQAFAGMGGFASEKGLFAAVRNSLNLDRSPPDFSKVQQRIDVGNIDATRPLIARLQDSTMSGKVSTLAVSPDGQFIAAAGEQMRLTTAGFGEQPVQEIRLWRVSDGALVAVTPDRQATPSSLSPIRSVGLARSKSKSTVPDVIQFSWSNDARPALSLSEMLSGQVILNQPTRLVSPIPNGDLQSWKVRFDRDHYWLTKQAAQGQEVGPFPLLDWFSSEILAAHLFKRQNKEYMAIGYRDGILVWDLAQLKDLAKKSARSQEQALVRCFYRHLGLLSCLSVSEEGDYLISGALDGSISLWALRGIEQPHDGVRELGLKLRRDSNTLLVEQLTEGLPAFFAGLKPNDQLVKLRVPRPSSSESDWIDRADQMESALRALPPGLGAVIQVRGQPGLLVAELLHEPLWTLYPMLDGQWVMATPAQVFGASSDEAMRRFGWHLNLGSQRDQQVALFPLDLFRETHERIALIAQTSWKGQRPVVRSSTDIPTLVEITEVQTADGQRASITNEFAQPVDLEVTLSMQRSGAETPKQLELWCNGRLIHQTKLEISNSNLPIVRWQVPKSALRIGDRNLLIAVVRSESKKISGKLDEPPVKLVNRAVRAISIAGTSRPKMHFLGVGVTDLEHEARFQLSKKIPIRPLRFAANDVCLLGLALADRAQASGFELGEFRYLVSKVPEGLDIAASQLATPTHDEVLEALDRLQEKAMPNDFVCVSISCHGSAADKGAYLFVQDSGPDFLNAVSDRELFEDRLWKLNCPALLLLDACHSGSALTGDSLRGLNGFGLGPEILVSCKPRQESFEEPELHQWGDRWFGMSVFTASLLEALTGRELTGSASADRKMSSVAYTPNIDRNRDGFLSVEELGLHATVRVPVLQKLPRRESATTETAQQPDLLPSLAFPRGSIRLRIPRSQ